MATSFAITESSLWPTLGQTLSRLAHHEILNRETLGAGVYARSLDRGNGMERTGAHPVDQELFGGAVAGSHLDTIASASATPRDAIINTTDAQRGMQTMHMGVGHLLDAYA